MMSKTVLALAAAQVATAHFSVVYPDWRGDTMSHEEDSEFDQWVYPCTCLPLDSRPDLKLTILYIGANVPFGEGNITDWPINGGAIQLGLGHGWTYLFVNVGLGNDTTDFNITLTPSLHNTTGEGNLCIDQLPIPEDSGITDGAIGSIQIITLDGSGSSLYNCADVRFVEDAPEAPSCNNTIEVNVIQGNSSSSHEEGHGSEGHGSDEEGTEEETTEEGEGEGAAGMIGVNMVSLTTFAGLSAVFIMGLGL